MKKLISKIFLTFISFYASATLAAEETILAAAKKSDFLAQVKPMFEWVANNIVVVGGLMIGLAALAMGMKWIKASFF